MAEGNADYTVADGVLYTKDFTTLLWCPVNKKSVSIPETVRTIFGRAFSKCTSLRSVVIPDSVTVIRSGTFANCHSLQEIVLSKSLKFVEAYAFEYCNDLSSLVCPAATPPDATEQMFGFNDNSYVFSRVVLSVPAESVEAYRADAVCGKFTHINLPVTDALTFDYDDTAKTATVTGCTVSITRLDIPATVQHDGQEYTVTAIRGRAFYGSVSMLSVTIPNTVTSIGSGAFGSCINLQDVSIGEGVADLCGTEFSSCSSLLAINVDADNPRYTSLDGVLYNKAVTQLISCPGGKRAVNIPEGVTEIGFGAFLGCSSLASVSIPESVSTIGSAAFNGCSSLKDVNIPSAVTAIAEGAFSSTGLTAVTIPATVTTIEEDAFASCYDLAMVTCEGATPPSADISTFSLGTYAVASLSVPEGSVDAYKAHEVWSKFFPLPTAIGGIGAESPSYRYCGGSLTVDGGPWSLYRLDGTLVKKSAQPTVGGVPRGTYILVTGRGRAKVTLR